jgi:hypothetical protein
MIVKYLNMNNFQNISFHMECEEKGKNRLRTNKWIKF